MRRPSIANQQKKRKDRRDEQSMTLARANVSRRTKHASKRLTAPQPSRATAKETKEAGNIPCRRVCQVPSSSSKSNNKCEKRTANRREGCSDTHEGKDTTRATIYKNVSAMCAQAHASRRCMHRKRGTRASLTLGCATFDTSSIHITRNSAHTRKIYDRTTRGWRHQSKDNSTQTYLPQCVEVDARSTRNQAQANRTITVAHAPPHGSVQIRMHE